MFGLAYCGVRVGEASNPGPVPIDVCSRAEELVGSLGLDVHAAVADRVACEVVQSGVVEPVVGQDVAPCVSQGVVATDSGLLRLSQLSRQGETPTVADCDVSNTGAEGGRSTQQLVFGDLDLVAEPPATVPASSGEVLRHLDDDATQLLEAGSERGGIDADIGQRNADSQRAGDLSAPALVQAVGTDEVRFGHCVGMFVLSLTQEFLPVGDPVALAPDVVGVRKTSRQPSPSAASDGFLTPREDVQNSADMQSRRGRVFHAMGQMGLALREVRNAHRDEGERFPTDAEFWEADGRLWNELDANLDAAASRLAQPATPTLEADEPEANVNARPLDQSIDVVAPPLESGPALPPAASQRSRGRGRGRRGGRGRGQAPQ